jgi:serine/threonine protein phosphatase 1
LFSVGDLADRGPESERALEYLEKPWFHAVRGNHEQFLLDSLDDRDTQLLWLVNGGGWFDQASNSVQRAFVRAFSGLPYVVEIETRDGVVGIVHADVPPGLSWSGMVAKVQSGDPQVLQGLLWSRHRALARDTSKVEGISHVFCGHTPVRPSARVVGNVHLIDQGAVFGLSQGMPESGLTMVSIDGQRVRTRAPLWPTQTSDAME